jgi:pSer/pThr/pTyr-binding forkhead associated (FHA) protein
MSVCPNCGKENQVHYKYCLGCGAELSEGSAPRQMPTPPPPAKEPRAIPRTVLAEEAPSADPPADDGMLGAIASALDKEAGTSPNWRPNGDPGTQPSADLDSGWSPVDTAPTPKASPEELTPPAPSTGRPCPTCGNSVPNDFAFCGQCGTRLEKISQQVRPMYQQPVASGGPRGRLVLVRPDGSEGGSHPIEEGENAIGRGIGTLFDADGYLSPRHAELVLNAAGLVVRDTGSLNGVFVKLTGEEEIGDADIFRIGQELLRFDEIRAPEPMDDGTEVLGSPNPGYWGRLAVIVAKEQDGSAFPLFGDAVVLGRERGDLVFPEDGYVSGTHARVAYRDGRYYLCDMNSSNGTFLRIRGERVVQSGAFLLMGQQLFRVVFQ